MKQYELDGENLVCPHCTRVFSINQPEVDSPEVEEMEEAEFWPCPYCGKESDLTEARQQLAAPAGSPRREITSEHLIVLMKSRLEQIIEWSESGLLPRGEAASARAGLKDLEDLQVLLSERSKKT